MFLVVLKEGVVWRGWRVLMRRVDSDILMSTEVDMWIVSLS